MPRSLIGRLLDGVRVAPPVLAILRLRYDRQFRRWPGAFRGVFPDFASARASAPRGMPVGYDAPKMTAIYDDRLDKVWPTDYPSMLWIQTALPELHTIFDFGGHVGISFYGFSRYLHFPPVLRWMVCDVPSVVERGRRLATERGAGALSFTTRFEDADGADVLHASGSLQYLEEPLGAMLDRLASPPRHLLLNKLPLHDGPAFVTLQHTVNAYNPYRVFNRQEFIGALTVRGYQLIDSWDDLDRSCVVPYRPGYAVHAYSGLYLRLSPDEESSRKRVSP